MPKIDELTERGPLQRAAIAEIAAAYIADDAHFKRASAWLTRFLVNEADEGALPWPWCSRL